MCDCQRLTRQSEDDYFSDGLTEELIHRLTRLRNLRVVAWNSASQLRGRDEDLRGLRELLKVGFLLRGSVVDLAVGVVIGVAFSGVVTALVKDLITPLVAAIGAQPDFGGLFFTVNNSRPGRPPGRLGSGPAPGRPGSARDVEGPADAGSAEPDHQELHH